MVIMNRKFITCLVRLLLIFVIINLSKGETLTFPDDLLFGIGTSAYQTEGAWNLQNKSENIWDHFTHTHPEKIADRSNGDVSADSYHNFKEDVKLVSNLGFNYYRFSLSWSRILPTGDTANKNLQGIKYYHDLLDELIKRNITPFVTIYHFDHPQSLEKHGGWLNRSMSYLYAEYAKFVFQEFGSKVKHFTTMNEIFVMCGSGYQMGFLAPGVYDPWSSNIYTCAENMLIAHAMAYRTYDREFRSLYNGIVGYNELCFNYYSKDPKDTKTKEMAFAFNCGWIFDPIMTGDYPEIMKEKVANISKARGKNESVLRPLPEKWVNEIKGSVDFLGLNYYTSMIVEQMPFTGVTYDWITDAGLQSSFDPKWIKTESPFFNVDPPGLGILLRRFRDRYNNTPIYIIENGVATQNETFRKEFFYEHMKELIKAIKVDKCNVKGYTVWTLLDFFEWISGYTLHFGMASVDYKDPNRTRTLKNSTSWLKAVLRTRKLIEPNLIN